jgi:hypothetical protein
VSRAFRTTTTSLIQATGVATPSIGMGHCAYGQSSFTSCATVGYVNQSISFAGYPTCKTCFSTATGLDRGAFVHVAT